MKKAVILSMIFSIMLCACGKASGEEGSKPVSEETAWNIYTYSETETGYQYTTNEYPVSDENELKLLLEKAESELKTPSYIPDGYAFESAYVTYYVTKEMLDGLSPEEKEENGSIVYEYLLPDEVLTQIDGFRITYSNEKGEKLLVSADYVVNMEIDTGNRNFKDLESTGYEAARAGLFQEEYVGEFFRNAQPVYEYRGNSEISLNCIFVRIQMPDENEAETVKIAESM